MVLLSEGAKKPHGPRHRPRGREVRLSLKDLFRNWKPKHEPEGRQSRFDLIVGVSLFLLLAFTTGTVFVKHAWALQSFQIGIYALVAAVLVLGFVRDSEPISIHPAAWLVYLIPLWGIVQLIAHTTSSTFATRAEVLRWGALAGVFFLTLVVARSVAARRVILTTMLGFATAMAVLCLLQLFTSDGAVLWMFPSGYPDIYATFPNHSNYAQFAELALPLALWRALTEGWRSWWYAVAGAVIYASVIGSASRAGTLFCTAEVLVMLLIWIVRQRNSEKKEKGKSKLRSTLAIVALIPVLAAVFTFAVGWQHVMDRFQSKHPIAARWDFLVAAVHMAESRPLTGFGLGTFPEVYQRYAVKDYPFYANHAHNDWAEFAADGGIPFLLLVLIPFAVVIPVAIRHPWGLGLVTVMIHAAMDLSFSAPRRFWMDVCPACIAVHATGVGPARQD